jgi:hypothetical protein
MNAIGGFRQDRETLVSFLRSTYDLLRNIYTEGVDPKGEPLVPDDFRELLSDAWSEFAENFNLEEAERRIRGLSPARMIAFGLFGAQLRLKLRVIDRLRENWLTNGGKEILKKLIDAIDTLLDSLLAATGIDEALKELKDILSGLLSV